MFCKPNSATCPRVIRLFLKLLIWYLSGYLRKDNGSSQKNDTLICHTASRVYGAADPSIHLSVPGGLYSNDAHSEP